MGALDGHNGLRKPELLGMGDPWEPFRSYLNTICAMQAADRRFP